MKRFIEGVDRTQSSLFPERLEDWIGEDNAVRRVTAEPGRLGHCPIRPGQPTPGHLHRTIAPAWPGGGGGRNRSHGI